MRVPNEAEVACLYGPDWRIVLMEAWFTQRFYFRWFYTLTGRGLWRIVRKIEESS